MVSNLDTLNHLYAKFSSLAGLGGATSHYLTIETPATEALIQIKLATSTATLAIPSLQITQPICGNVDAGSNDAHSNACSDQHQPHIASIKKSASMTQQSLSTRVEKSFPLALLGILIDPIDSSKVVITNTSSWTFDIPV
jgi:hypothetical protein